MIKKLLGTLILGIALAAATVMPAHAEENELIKNGNFSDFDLTSWEAAKGNAVISVYGFDGDLVENLSTAGRISERTAPYECFAQDITGLVESGKEYDYTFYACLSEDYEDAPAEQRNVEFSPYYTVDGETTYMGSWSGDLSGQVSQTLEPGVWTKFSGVMTPDMPGEPTEFVIRIIEQGTNYGQGDCVLGEYYVTQVSLKEHVAATAEETVFEKIDTSAKPLKDAVCEVMGENFIVGCAVTGGEIADKGVKEIIEHHFNAVTLGNELKPDCLFAYSNGKCPGTEVAELNGEELVVPKFSFKSAEKILNVIYEWNQAHPDEFIKVRGHVLVWHAQTPEWFFHEDYDKNKDYVSPEVMNKRLEWYIKTVLEHFTAPDSKYYGMFYGWDVVNEAVSDATHTYRSDKENANESLLKDTHGNNSSWWHVYQSNEFIINAFRFANKYAPSDVELYYNDYNETQVLKMKGIVQLIEDVKAAEGTRIDGMGMQGHYSASEMMQDKVLMAARNYSEAAGKVMITEWDMNSSEYDGTEETRATVYTKIAHRYEFIYNTIKTMADEGINFGGFTFWGTVDKYSWLQSRSDVGGGSDGKSIQCPLLFDNDYNIKPAYWAFVDSTHINDMIAERNAFLEKQKEEAAANAESSAKDEKDETSGSANDQNTDAGSNQSEGNEQTSGDESNLNADGNEQTSGDDTIGADSGEDAEDASENLGSDDADVNPMLAKVRGLTKEYNLPLYIGYGVSILGVLLVVIGIAKSRKKKKNGKG